MPLSIKTPAIAAVTALSVGLSTAPAAHAWGKKEQGFLAGVVTAIIIDELLDTKKSHAAPAPAPKPVVVTPKPSDSGAAARAFNSYSKSERKAIQRQLRAYGYYHGKIDGVFGRGTRDAVVAYARDAGALSSLQSTAGAYAIYDGLLY